MVLLQPYRHEYMYIAVALHPQFAAIITIMHRFVSAMDRAKKKAIRAMHKRTVDAMEKQGVIHTPHDVHSIKE